MKNRNFSEDLATNLWLKLKYSFRRPKYKLGDTIFYKSPADLKKYPLSNMEGLIFDIRKAKKTKYNTGGHYYDVQNFNNNNDVRTFYESEIILL